MRKLITGIVEKWRQRKRERAELVLDELKIRYHTFRIILAHNEISLDLMRSVDQSTRWPGSSGEDLAEEIEELLSVTYELVDGLNRLTGNRYGALFEKFRSLARAIRDAMAAVMARPTHMLHCVSFDHLTVDNRVMVGGKAATLAMLKQAGFPVPDGFAITARACSGIFSENGLDGFIRQRLQRLESRRLQAGELEAEANEIRERILAAPIHTALEDELRLSYKSLTDGAKAAISVRSSALVEDRLEHSFAGQFKSILNVTSFEGLKEAFKEVIASNYSSRSILYRLNAGIPLGAHDMAVFCQRMVPAKAAGGLFTLDPAAPESARMLISAVPGLGILAVSGSAPADLYRPLRDTPRREPMHEWAQISLKTHRAIELAEGGVGEEEMPEEERITPVLSREEAVSLVRFGRMIESLMGKPQDIEWAIGQDGQIFILQSRDIRLPIKNRQAVEGVRGKSLLKGGVCASPGRCVGVIKVIRAVDDIEEWRRSQSAPGIMVLHQSLPDAAGWLPEFEGVVVDLGNPADHLSCVAREYSRPMLTGTGKATEILRDGQWVILDADSAMLLEAPKEVWAEAASMKRKKESHCMPSNGLTTPELDNLRRLIEPLNLTDAYGPTFSIQECRSLHDVIRYTHEMAVLAMFDLGDVALEEADIILRHLDEGLPFDFFIIDLGGGITPGRNGPRVTLGDILSAPLLALWKGIATPGLRWSRPPPVPGLSGLFTRSILDGRSARPVGSQNYALITRDYLNLNARVDYHFAMVDAVCGANPRENYIRFRFKGGGTSAVQRERRARFVVEVLESHSFFADRQGDLVTASILETRQEEIQERLVILGRLLGFSRLLDASMSNDTMPRRMAQAFLDGDYALESLSEELAAS